MLYHLAKSETLTRPKCRSNGGYSLPVSDIQEPVANGDVSRADGNSPRAAPVGPSESECAGADGAKGLARVPAGAG